MRNANFGSKNSSPQWKPLRVLGILFCLIVFTAGLAGAAGAEGIVITDTTFTTPGNAEWLYDSTHFTGTLRLNGGTWDNITVSNSTINNLIIELANGENNITPGTSVTIGGNYCICGIYVDGNLEIRQKEGDPAGSLNVTVSDSGTEDVYGIRADGTIIISGGEVNVTVNDDSQAWGIYASSQYSINPSEHENHDVILIAGSTVTAKASAPNATGISIKGYGQIKIRAGGIVTAKAIGSHSAKGIFAEDGNIENNAGTVTATATSSGGTAYGLYASGSSGFGIIRIGMHSEKTTAVGSSQAISATPPLVVSPSQSIRAGADTTENGLNSVTVNDFIGNFYPYKYVEITKASSSNDPSDTGSPGNPQSSSSSGSAGDGRYYSFPRTTDNGGSVTFGKSPVVTEIILPQGSKGSVVLSVESVEDWPGIEQTPYAFEITAPEKADGISEILFRVELSELERLEAQPEGIGIFVKKGDEWMPLLSVFELGEKYVYYTVETDTLGEFEIRFEEGGAVSGETEEPVEPETPADPVIPDEPQEVLPPIEPPVKDEEPKSPMPILAVLAGLSAAAALRRK